ncbi:ATP-dependent protease [Moraxella caviae]|uniref:ATP-dependent protease n=1 Tax=Moraxella caviae TaxID=34060 RepID=A0A1T0A0X6_9GAMM|nr:YifB family Mg chelatase-like AAA ATPase [Moraxella caviae]OOR89380.1 ATP-dependent protease [Moraxella caviae]STZ09898.1 Competence protein ComM [Moraxella caviae]
MSFAQVFTRSVVGLHAPNVTVEVHLSQGMPALTIVGLPEASVRESKDRVRSAILNSGFDFPNRRLTINLAPADLPKDGARLDLPIAISMLAASGQLDESVLGEYEFIGELALNGELRAVTGALAVARAIKASQTLGAQNTNDNANENLAPRTLIVPKENAIEAAKVAGVTVLAAETLEQVCRHLDVVSGISNDKSQLLPVITHTPDAKPHSYALDLADVKGQHHARRALEIAAAGGHSLLFTGSPGSGKTLMASRLPSILPPLSDEEALEVASIYSVAGAEYEFGVRPFRACHHTISAVALVGGGSKPKPGEISLAHFGALFLDELPEFDRKTLEVLRQPIESKEIIISRANSQVRFPANFQLVAAMNPCPCGYHGDGSGRCHCKPEQVRRYQDKISGPLLDRIDLHIHVPAMPIDELQTAPAGESSEVVRARVLAARERQMARQNKPNSELSPSEIDKVAPLGDAEQQLLRVAQARLNLSARSYHRVLRVARTIADLAGLDEIGTAQLAEALSYR